MSYHDRFEPSRTAHPKADEIEQRGDGPAKIVFRDGDEHYTRNLAYTTALEYVTMRGRPMTVTSDAIKYIQWLDEMPDRGAGDA